MHFVFMFYSNILNNMAYSAFYVVIIARGLLNMISICRSLKLAYRNENVLLHVSTDIRCKYLQNEFTTMVFYASFLFSCEIKNEDITL